LLGVAPAVDQEGKDECRMERSVARGIATDAFKIKGLVFMERDFQSI